MDRERLKDLRAAVYRGDGISVVAVLGERVPSEVLQLAGDGIAVAVAAQVAGAAGLAEECARSLRDRGWPGDEELATELDAALGRGPLPSARILRVDLDELLGVLETGPGDGGGVVDLGNGDVWSASAVEYASETDETPPDFDDSDRWLYVMPEGSNAGYRDMEDFIATLVDPCRAERLAIAIDGKSAFKRFKDTLARWPDDEARWYRFSDERHRGRARQWLADAGYRAIYSFADPTG